MSESTATTKRSRSSPKSTSGGKGPVNAVLASQPAYSSSPSRAGGFLSGIQRKVVIGQVNDPYEREADRVADFVVSGSEGTLPAISHIGSGGLRSGSSNTGSVGSPGSGGVQPQKGETEEQVQEHTVQRQDEEKEPVQESVVQRQTEEEEPVQEMAIQRQEEEEPVQEFALQRQAEEEEPIQEFAIQRQSEEEEPVQEMAIQRQEEEPIQELTVQRQNEEEEPDVQRQQEEQVMAKSDEPRAASPTLESRMRSTQSEGASLKDATRAEMESHLETDLSNVKVHSGANAAKMNKELGAQAFTHGNHIYFGEGKYKPDSKEGKRLIAHEVTHTVQQTGGMHKKASNISSAPEKIQRLSLPFADRIADYAAQIPGYTLLTVIIGFDPIRNSSVPRTATNLLRGFFGLIPLGVLLFDKLSELEIVERAFNWVNMELAKLDISLERVNRIIAQAWEDTDFLRLDLIEYNVGVIRRHLAPLYNDVLAFANSAVTTVLGMVKEALLNRLKSFAEGNPAYPLLTQILGRDPITGENVQRNLVVMIESFLQLIGAEEELQKMRETGTIQRVADWLNSELAQLNFSWDEVAALFRQAWGAFSLEDLRDPMGAFQRTVNIFAPFVERVLRFARNVAVKVLEFIKDALLNYLKNFAAELPGYPLFTVILGRDPFTGEIVPRTAENFIRGFLSFVPGGEEKFRNLQESGAIQRAMAWLENEIALLDLSWATIRELFTSAWQSLSIRDLMDPVPAFRRMVDLFAEPVQRIIRFAGNVGMKILEFIFEGVMGAGGARVLEILKRGRDTFMLIINDPVAFLGHLLEAVKTGFQQFAGNIWDHLKRGLLGWLFGALQGAGIKLPETFDLKGIISLVLQILGITYQGIRAKLVKHIGEERVAMLERVFEFVRGIITEGPGYLWNKLLEFVGNIKDMVMGAIQNWVVTRIVQAAITKLATMLNPVGAVIQSIIAIYDTIMFFIERINQILDLVESIVNSITEIATGNIARAANFVEQTMGRTVPVIISFLARLIGLGGISDTIRDIINRIRQPVDKALDRIVAWIVGQARKIIGKGKAVVKKAKDIVFAKFHFEAEGKKNTLKIEKKGKKGEIVVASSPGKPVAQYLYNLKPQIKNISDPKKKMDAEQAYDEALETRKQAVEKLEDVFVPPKKGKTPSEKAVNIKTSKLLNLIKKIWKLIGVSTGLLPGEAEVGTYSTLKGQPKMTPHHIPQNGILKRLRSWISAYLNRKEIKGFREHAEQKLSGLGIKHTQITNYSMSAGISFQMERIRHNNTRTFGKLPENLEIPQSEWSVKGKQAGDEKIANFVGKVKEEFDKDKSDVIAIYEGNKGLPKVKNTAKVKQGVSKAAAQNASKWGSFLR